MFSAHSKYVLSFAALAATMLSSALPASAGAFNVKPIRVFLSKDTDSTVLTIENQDQRVLRLQVRAFAWSNDRQGQPVLTPSDDLIVFPTLVDINPMEHRSIRIGFSGTAAAKELTYRIALDEMPSLESQLSRSKQPGLEVRTRITVPVFFSPLISTTKAQIDDLSLNKGVVRVSFSNQGNVHATVSKAEIIGRDSSGSTVFEKSINGWYVLAGQDWDFQASTGHSCGKIKWTATSGALPARRTPHRRSAGRHYRCVAGSAYCCAVPF
jgi:fimbrial chaperone protein